MLGPSLRIRKKFEYPPWGPCYLVNKGKVNNVNDHFMKAYIVNVYIVSILSVK